jgi:uncharacterized protein (TIGR00255 family)
MSTVNPIFSMTGFASSRQSLPTPSAPMLEIELRSVNQRYVEWQLKCPDSLRFLEPSLRVQAQQLVQRGKLECRINLHSSSVNTTTGLNEAMVNHLLLLQQSVLALNPAASTLTVADLLRWPGVLGEADAVPDVEALQAAATTLFGNTLLQFQQSRAAEGEALRHIMLARIQTAHELAKSARQVATQLQALIPERLQQKLASIIETLDPQRVEQEIVLQSSRLDVSEELDRLQTHLNEMQRLLQAGGSLGKRLDFLCQELNREANTLGAKSTDVGLTQLAVSLKVTIEQIREQVQNVE